VNEPSDAEDAYAMALASFGVSPGRLRTLLRGFTPAEAWQALAAGRHPGDADAALRSKATEDALVRAFRARAGSPVEVKILGGRGYPRFLAADPDPPAVLFVLGELDGLENRPRVAVVGTRSATPTGLGIAEEVGASLSSAGVSVVSGLARGIDSAAHLGSLRTGGAPAIAVLGTALDATAPPAQLSLRREVAASGVVLSELPPGVAGARWWFAVRNRVMAALAHVVVVVEAHATGGALHTVRAARRRGVPVAAVPGSVRSPASAGANALLVEGASPVRHADDVLDLLGAVVAGLSGVAWPRRADDATRARGRTPDPRLSAEELAVRRALDQDPVSLDVVVLRTGMPLGEVALALERLADAGQAVEAHGWWARPHR